MTRAALILFVVACGNDVGAPPEAALPERVRLLTDAQYANAVHDLLGVTAPRLHSPGTQPHQLIHDDNVLAVDAPLLVQYRLAAQTIARGVTVELDVDAFASRAFRRPLEPEERTRLHALHARGGFPLVVEAVLQAPSFIYRVERGPQLDAHELAAAVGFLFLDSIPDEPLWQAARDGSLVEPAVLAAHVDRLLALPRVRAHLTEVVLQWLRVHDIRSMTKEQHLAPETRDALFEQARLFVHDVLWQRGGSLRELLASHETFVDARLAGYYGLPATGWHMVPRTVERAGILTHPGVLAMLGTPGEESVIQRGIYIHRTFLCTEELGRPPFAAIADTHAFITNFTQAQQSHFRMAHVYCSSCHRRIDPPGLALHRYDVLGRSRDTIEDDVELPLDGTRRRIRGANELGQVLAESDQVARCVVDRLAHHALGRAIPDAATRSYLEHSFARDRDIVALFRAIALSPLFRGRQ